MKILSNEEIQQIEQRTLEAQNITELDLVERVASAVAEEVKMVCRPDGLLIVLAGWGNNGADALESARLLALDGYKPVVYLFNIGGQRLSPSCDAMRLRLAETPAVTFYEVTGAESFKWVEPPSSATVIDGLFGRGLNRTMPRSFQLIAHSVNQSGAYVISIDIPSGLMSEWNGASVRNDMMHASLTLSVEFPKLAFMLAENAEVVGKWKTIRIGFDTATIKEAPFTFTYVDRGIVSRMLPRRKEFSSKADYGHALLIAGSRGMMGAAVLAARGALRSGAGKVSVISCADGCDIVQSAAPCAMFVPTKKNDCMTEMPFSNKYDAVGVGCGIGTAEETANAFEKFVKSAQAAGRRLVIDADALNIIATRPLILNFLPALSVITPHAGEFDRIFGESSSDEERLRKAIKCAEDYMVVIVLKGRYTTVIRPDGQLMFNSTGTPAMATAGAGDVLTGLITGLMATGMRSELAAFVGPYIHGLAGQIAEQRNGQYGVTANDIADNIGVAIKQIMGD